MDIFFASLIGFMVFLGILAFAVIKNNSLKTATKGLVVSATIVAVSFFAVGCAYEPKGQTTLPYYQHVVEGAEINNGEQVYAGVAYTAGASDLDPISQSKVSEEAAYTLGLTEVLVTRVIDGDTVELSNGERVRFIGIDAPEIGEPGADEATNFVRGKIEGKKIWLEADGNDRDRFDRLRRYVWLQIPTDTQDEKQIRSYQLNAMLLENGLASVLVVGEMRNEDLFRQLSASAPAPTPEPLVSTPEPAYVPAPSPTPAEVVPTPAPSESVTAFIGNRNSHVFHRTSCSSLPAPQNRVSLSSRQDAIDRGFRACQRCRP